MPDTRKSGEHADHVALVTGAASGIGRGTALRMAEEGWGGVVMVDRDAALLERSAAEVRSKGARVFPLVADLSDLVRCEALVGEAVKAAGRLDQVVNSAAIARPAILGRDLARHLIAAKRPGAVVFIASINAQGAGVGSVGYCASKAGVVALMKVMAAELGEHGIRVNSVSPGPTDTPRSVGRVGEKVMERLRSRFDGAALRRLGQPSEIADAVIYLCSDRSSYVSGHDLVVDGGLMASVYVAAKPE